MKGLDWFRVMSNIAFDDDLEHRSDAAFRTYLELIGISAFDLSDGKVSLERAKKLCNTPDVDDAIAELFAEKYIKNVGSILALSSYRKYQLSRREVQSKRAKNRAAVSDYRAMTKAPVIEQSKSKSKSKNNTPKPPSDKSDTFAEFWGSYPRKQGKGQAERAYKAAIKKATPEVIMAGLESQLGWFASQVKTEGDFRPLAATWLNGERWADELQAVPGQSIPDPKAREKRIAHAVRLINEGSFFKEDARMLVNDDDEYIEVLGRLE